MPAQIFNPAKPIQLAPAIDAAIAALRAGDIADAERILRNHIAHHANDAPALAKLAEIYCEQNRLAEAAYLLRHLLQLAPDAHPAHLSLARILHQQRDPKAALDHIRQLPPAVRSGFDVAVFEAAVLADLGRHERQVAIYDKLLKKHPKNARLWMTYGNALVYCGKIAQAVRALRRAVAIEPGFGEGWWSLANLKTVGFEPGDLSTMRAAIGELARADALHLHFALGKALEEIGNYAESFHHYAEGNRLRAETFLPDQMSAARLTADVDAAIRTFDRPLFDRLRGAGHPARDPIFVVGLQRSGSTLIEQILASHPAIEGTSELDSMFHIWSDLCRTAEQAGKTVWTHVESLDGRQLAALGADYLERTRPFRTTDRPYFVDKRPANWIYAGLIKLILPNATIIDARRHPMACGFSNFKQHYANGAPFSYSLPSIGSFWAEYLRLMDHLEAVQPGLAHLAVNEDLIDNPEGEIRRLIDAVGVPFDPACLEFHRNRRTVRTASAEQVRRPINRDGLDQWRHYEPWLAPLADALGPALTRWRS